MVNTVEYKVATKLCSDSTGMHTNTNTLQIRLLYKNKYKRAGCIKNFDEKSLANVKLIDFIDTSRHKYKYKMSDRVGSSKTL